jgi:uncharacterized membrane protein YjgN (DUF898 family)
MAKRRAEKAMLHDITSIAHGARHHVITETIAYETRKRMVINMLILMFGIALAVIVVTSVLRIFAGL